MARNPLGQGRPQFDGGPAFPSERGPDGDLHPAPGMSLRDWLAGQALAGLLASNASVSESTPDEEVARVLAIGSYAIADAMISERSKGGG